jgi:eukaryotic-like serine/threonine-protein kinase
VLEVQRSRIGRYEVLAELGRGAMGIVYRARDPQIDRVVAIKTLRPDLGLPGDAFAELRQRFYQEATAAGRLNHPNIVAIHDVLDVDGVPYIVMECLEGRTVADLLAAEGRLDVRRAVRLFAQVCEALDYAHARGVVHRDIKPSNIVVIDDDVAKVTDFGIARVTGSTVTQTGAVLGTPAYMSPEQLRGKVPDGRSDLFAVGVSLYEALAGANPFHSEELAAVLYRVVHEAPAPLRERNPGVSPVLQAAIERAVAKDPSERHPTARAFGEALARSVGPATAGQTTVILPEGARRRRRRRLAPALIGLVALLATGGGWAAWSAWSWLSTEPPDSASPPSTAAQPAARRTIPPGAIRISTNAAVDVLVDGEVRGRSNGPPLVIANVPAGDRVVTLRLGEREHSLSAFVPEGQTVALRYQFPPESAPSPSAEDVGRRTRETVDRLRGTVDKTQKEAVQTLRGVLDRAGSALDQAVGRGRPGSSKSEGR